MAEECGYSDPQTRHQQCAAARLRRDTELETARLRAEVTHLRAEKTKLETERDIL
ncbi:hypothetical protein R4P64_31895 [Rhodococcus sp. IEGM 1366]|uniref:hypothetical protein n=1 Tax=Rhodococcus sp. IEGM 1366 TaxID=3082223 RepID=UPI002955C579|nr:hypothetical protein [Rhodococcus sp. IEGM 1366]MDV8071124.1 hypothetical protein [Rhodococcus sp. IEGM 1366]